MTADSTTRDSTSSLATGAGATTATPTTTGGAVTGVGAGTSTGMSAGGGAGGYRPEEWREVPASTHREIEVVDTRPSATMVAGAAIAGALVGAAVPFMLASRASGSTRSESTTVEESVIINRPPHQIYDFWRDFTNLPQFMDNIESVTKINEVRSHWKIKAPAGTSVEFNSLVTEDIPGRLIAWKSEEGATVPNRGRVEFIETSSGGGTNVRATISYDPPAGALGRVVAKLFQREPGVQARQDLDRLKQLLER
ncbi:MAG TPA: SRPBCC family protein [Allosphingosinicella sp.]|nr:SRPBCC family protein [Allosphingosinicella sp.]